MPFATQKQGLLKWCGIGQRGRPFGDFHNWRSMATFSFFWRFMWLWANWASWLKVFLLGFFSKRPGGNLMQKPRRKPWATRQRGTLQPLDGQREWFHEYCSLCYRDMDRNDICKPNTFFEYMVSIRWSPPFPTKWYLAGPAGPGAGRLVRLSTRLLLPLETQSPRVCCQNLKVKPSTPQSRLCAANGSGPIAFILGIQWLATQSSSEDTVWKNPANQLRLIVYLPLFTRV